MTAPPPSQPFQRRAFFDQGELVGARWWQESLATHVDPVTRRAALRKILLIGSAIGAAGLVFAAFRREEPSDPILTADALDLQKQLGWDVGRAGERLELPGATSADVAGQTDWRDALPGLAEALAPARPELAPFYVPTLFQSLAPPTSASLRAFIAPIHDAAMDQAYARGQALAALFADPAAPGKAAVLVDAPGPIAVAVAAGMADRFEPVFLLDNWPHPAGVVPSHLALAAALYYRPRFLAARGSRNDQGATLRSAPRSAEPSGAPGAPPVFVGDDQRLAPYTDASDRFDNRYLLRLPSGARLRELGVERLLYVRPRPGQAELDDLNDDFVALDKAGVQVKVVALDDFQNPDASAPQRYYWGGHPATHVYFWPTYGWYRGPARPAPAVPVPAHVGTGASYTPAPRPTMFSSRTVGGSGGVGRQKPSGFGRVSYRAGDGASGRSGSFGRTSGLGGE